MNKFSRIYIEITNMCNLKCSFCIKNTREPRFMSEAEFAHILQQIRPYTSYICLHVLGEPLMHPLLAQFLAHANDANMKVNITTNGTLLRATQDVLLNAPALRKISVSLHSLEDKSNMDVYLQDVAKFVTKAAEKSILCDLRLWNLSEAGVNNEPVFETLCNYLSISEARQQEAMDKISKSGSITLAPTIFLGTAPRFEWPSMQAEPTNHPVFCYGLRTQGAILCDGSVVPCCLDSKGDINLGNIFTQSFEQIITSERVQKIHDGFSNRRPHEELCKRCGYATRF